MEAGESIKKRLVEGGRRAVRPVVTAVKSRKVRRVTVFSLVTVLLLTTLFYVDVMSNGAPIYRALAAVPSKPVAIVFGAGLQGQEPGLILSDRVRTAANLYRAGKVRKLLLTGDNSRVGYNEPEAMRRAALRFGVPERDIVLDYAGFRTYDSLYRARDIFGVKQAVLVTQAYHLPRALYIGRGLGLDVVGAAADLHAYPEQRHLSLRELFSIENAWFQVRLFHPQPHFLGPKEPILP